MNIYILNAILTGKVLSEVLCRKLSIKGFITLDEGKGEKTSEYYDYSYFCEKQGIDYICVETYNCSATEDREKLEKLEIDLIIVAGWQRLIPEWLIRHCRIGVIGAHGSPDGIERGRGRSPQNWALLIGKDKFSLSIFWIEPGIDSGNIIDTTIFNYLPTDTILVSYVKTNLYIANMILKNIKNGRIERKEGVPQGGEGMYLPQRTKEDGKIDWNRTAADISNMVRALTRPYPGAYTIYEGEEFYIWTACPVILDDIDLYDQYENGTVVSVLGGSVLIKCGKDLLLLSDCTNMEKMEEGMVFESADYKSQIQNIIDRHNKKYGTPLSGLVLDEGDR